MPFETSLAVGEYVNVVMAAFVSLPGAPARASRGDRRLARGWYGRGVALATVRAAFLLAAARRELRSTAAGHLEPMRTLHYLGPVIEEVLEQAPDADHVEYLAGKLRSFMRPGSPLVDSG